MANQERGVNCLSQSEVNKIKVSFAVLKDLTDLACRVVQVQITNIYRYLEFAVIIKWANLRREM